MRLLYILYFAVALGYVGARAPKPFELPRRASVTVKGNDVSGQITMEQASVNSPVKIRGIIYGLTSGRHGLHLHEGSSLGYHCNAVGHQFAPSERMELPAGYLGNVKTLSGNPSRTEVSLISSSVSLYEDTPRNILNRAFVVHSLPDNMALIRNLSPIERGTEDPLLACGLVLPAEVGGTIAKEPQSTFFSENIFKAAKDGEAILEWENVPHPKYGAVEDQTMNINVESPSSSEVDMTKLNLGNVAPTRKVWMTGYTYEYDYAGWSSTGVMGVSSQVSGGSIKGRLVIEPVDESILNVALLNTKAKQFNEDIVKSLSETDPGMEVRIMDQEYLEKPFQLRVTSGKIENVRIPKDEPLWVVNFKRGLVAQIQLQLDSTSGVFHKSEWESYYADNVAYHVMEGCSTGECQTWYTISPLPDELVESEPKLLPVPELCRGHPIYQISKNRNLDKCRTLPVFHYNSNEGLQCNVLNGVGCENKITHVDTVKIVGCTTSEGNFIVQHIKTIDSLVVKPFSYETEATEGLTIQELNLKAANPTSYSKLAFHASSDSGSNVYQTLAYSFDSDYMTYGPLMGKPTLRNVNLPMVMEVETNVAKSEAIRLLKEIVTDLESESYYVDPSSKHVSGKINMLRRAFGYFDYPELMALIDSVWENQEWSTQNQILTDTLMLTGTNPSLLIVRDFIVNGRITGEWAVQAVASLPSSVNTPTKELLSSWMEFLKSDVVSSHRQLKLTTALSLTRLVYQACINSTNALNMFPKLVMGEFCNPSDSIISIQLVPWLVEELKRTNDAGERQALLIALGNIGHEMIVPYIKPYITSCEPSTHYENEWYQESHPQMINLSKKQLRKKWLETKKTAHTPSYMAEEVKNMFPQLPEEEFEDEALCNLIRVKAIFALSHLALEKNDIIPAIMIPIAFNKAEDTEVRLAALTLLFITNPTQSFWNRAAVSTWYEPNDQVAHFIYTTIASKVYNKDPVDREVIFRAESALPLMKPMFWTSNIALCYKKSGYVEKSRLGYVAKVTMFPGFESFVPSNLYTSLAVNIGPWFNKLMELSIGSRHAEKFVDSLFGLPGLRFKPNKDESSIVGPELAKIHEELKIEARATGQPELFIYVNLLDNYQRFYTINPQTIYSFLKQHVIKMGIHENVGKTEINYHKYVPTLDTFTRIPSSMGLAYSWISHHNLMISVKSKVEGSYSLSNWNAKFEGVLKPVITKRMTARLMVETPFYRSYPTSGINMDISVALPGTFGIEGDLKSAKFVTSWEFAGDKLRLAKHSVFPFTTIHKVADFTPAALLPETKRVTYTDEVKKNTVTFGENTVGLNFIWTENGDVHSVNQPWAYSEDWLGTWIYSLLPSSIRQRDWIIDLDNTNSRTKIIKTYLGLSKRETSQGVPFTSHLNAKSMLRGDHGESIFGGKYSKEEKSWMTPKSKSWTAPLGWFTDVTVEFSPRSSSIQSRRLSSSSMIQVMDSVTKQHRSNLMMEQPHQSSENNFVFCADIAVKPPTDLLFRTTGVFKEDVEPSSFIKLGFGKSCTDDRKIFISTEWTRVEEKLSPSLRNKVEEALCGKHEGTGRTMSQECVAVRRKTGMLNKATINIEYNEMPPILTNITVKANNLFRYWWGAHMTDNQVHVNNPDGKITLEMVYWPIASTMDLRFYKPRSNTFYNSIEVHPIAEVTMPQRMFLSHSYFTAPGFCSVGDDSVSTFDGVFYNATFSDCNQVLVKDCSGRYKFAILGREEGDKKIITVLIDNEKVEIFSGRNKAKVNGMDIDLSSQGYTLTNSENEVLAIVKKTTDNLVEVDSSFSHMFRVLSDGSYVFIVSSPIHHGRLCGLCGSATGNKMTDLTGPRQCSLPRNLMDVAYELKTPTGCKSEISAAEYGELRRIQQQCLKTNSETVFGISKQTPILPKTQQVIFSLQLERQPYEWMTYRNKMLSLDNQRCFSTEPLIKCSAGSRITGTEERKVSFHCLPIEHELSKKMSEELSYRALDELIGKTVDIVRVYSVPTGCAPF